MNTFFRVLLAIHLIMVVVCTMVMLYFISEHQPKVNRLCSVAEISPDFTPEERERCRLIRGRKL
jgi:hypothetical protein